MRDGRARERRRGRASERSGRSRARARVGARGDGFGRAERGRWIRIDDMGQCASARRVVEEDVAGDGARARAMGRGGETMERGRVVSRTVSAVEDSGEEMKSALEADAARVAAKFDPLDIDAKPSREVKRKLSRKKSEELYPGVFEALRSQSRAVRDATKKIVDAGKVDDETERTFQQLKNLPVVLPKPFDASNRMTAREIPEAPKIVSKAFGDAIVSQDFNWALREEIASLFSRDVDYMNIHGDFFQGKDEVMVSLCDSVKRMSQRLRMSSARGDSGTLSKYTKMTTTGPTYKGRGTEKEWSSWVMEYTFKILLLTIKIRETYYIDDTSELICHIARQRIY